jgi:heme exporter protein D
MMVFGIDLGNHAGFVVASYAIFFVVVIGLIAWVVVDGRAQRRALADLESRGVRRRSDVTTIEPAPASPAESGSIA